MTHVRDCRVAPGGQDAGDHLPSPSVTAATGTPASISSCRIHVDHVVLEERRPRGRQAAGAQPAEHLAGAAGERPISAMVTCALMAT